MWLSPENDWNWKTRGPFDFNRYAVPGSMDPGAWACTEASESQCVFTQRARMEHLHRKSFVAVEIRRTFYRQPLIPAGLVDGGVHIAYQTDTRLTILDGTEGQPVGLWSLVQIPAGGRLMVHTVGEARLRDYFAPIPASHWECGGAGLSLAITGAQQFKVGVAPHAVAGRLTYSRGVSDGTLSIDRFFNVSPWRVYADHPLLDEYGQGDAVQVYNDGGDFGGFGEMEHHAPQLIVGRGPEVLVDSCLTVVSLK